MGVSFSAGRMDERNLTEVADFDFRRMSVISFREKKRKMEGLGNRMNIMKTETKLRNYVKAKLSHQLM